MSDKLQLGQRVAVTLETINSQGDGVVGVDVYRGERELGTVGLQRLQGVFRGWILDLAVDPQSPEIVPFKGKRPVTVKTASFTTTFADINRKAGTASISATPLGHLVWFSASAVLDKIWSVEEMDEVKFLHGELLELEWANAKLDWLPAPEIPEKPDRLIHLRDALGDRLIARVQLLDDDQAKPGTVNVPLADLYLADELSVTPEELAFLQKLEEGRWLWERDDYRLRLEAQKMVRWTTICEGQWELAPKGEMALWWAAKKREGD